MNSNMSHQINQTMHHASRIFGPDGEVQEQQNRRYKFQKHINILMWKSTLMRQRRWRILLIETLFALLAFLVAIGIGKPVFLTALVDQPEPKRTFNDIINTLDKKTIVGYAPNSEPYVSIMKRTAELLGIDMLAAKDNNGLNELLYKKAQGITVYKKVIWIIWKKTENQVYKFKIRTTVEEESSSTSGKKSRRGKLNLKPNLTTGFLAMQVAISHALLEHEAKPVIPDYQLDLVSMPISPLMDEATVKRTISLILMCYTIAFLPPVLETEALVVTETNNNFKRALRIRGVEYVTMYFGWLTYALLTAMPICMLGSITLIVIFRWIYLTYALITLLFYFLVMMMLGFIMALAHKSAMISCVWTILQTLLQTFLAELMVHHEYEKKSDVINFFCHMILPPMGLLNGLNEFSLLQNTQATPRISSMESTVLSWIVLIFVYFMLLMLLQRTMSAAIGGQVSWESIIFKHVEDPLTLHPVTKPAPVTGSTMQEVDELTAKAVSFRNVSKSIMNTPVLSNVTFDIYRGEYTILFSEHTQCKLMTCVADLLTGLTYADSGIINVLGVELNEHWHPMTEPRMMGYCDGSSYLIDDLTVTEHFHFYIKICTWNQSNDNALEYLLVRTNRLKVECDLESVIDKRVEELGVYYKAQLCWAIAMLLEPRIIVIPDHIEAPLFEAVIRDKIKKYKHHLSIIDITRSSLSVEFADRLFLFDNRILAFGGTPAYMFFKFGREYSIRISCKSMEEESAKTLLQRLAEAGASVRAYLGSLLIIRMPTSPSSRIAELLFDLEANASSYGVASLCLCLPDPEEVFRRAIHESRNAMTVSDETRLRSKLAVINISERRKWTRFTSFFMRMHINYIGWKYFSFYVHYRFFFIMTVLAAIVTGACIGYDLGIMLRVLEKTSRGEEKILTVEVLKKETTLVVQVDQSQMAIAVADRYVISQIGATKDQISKVGYVALPYPQSLTEFLVTRAIDSPQEYVHLHAYGMKVIRPGDTGPLQVSALYSPIHQDRVTAARSLARVYMALMRYYSGKLSTSLEIEDDPLTMDTWTKSDEEPPLLIGFLLVLTISHMTMIPSKEYGLIRHTQKYSLNFSPLGYWLSLAFCDLILYWMMIILMLLIALIVLMIMVAQLHYFAYTDLMIVPFMLMIYGFGCIPQAYLFSLGPRPSLNYMAFVIINLVFGEATILAKFFYGYEVAYKRALNLMSFLPQFNMAYALVKIKRTFLLNSECPIYKGKKLCTTIMLHRCCPKCGVLHECFSRESYLSTIMPEMVGTLCSAIIFMIILQLWEYKFLQPIFRVLLHRVRRKSVPRLESESVFREKNKVLEKQQRLKDKADHEQQDTFGEFLLAVKVSKTKSKYHAVKNVYLGLGKGEALALAGVKYHGRHLLFQILGGLKTSNGVVWIMSKYKNTHSPYRYASNVAMCADMDALPDWMSVYDALEMIAVLRGVPKTDVQYEVQNYINALDLFNQENLLICRLHPGERNRLNFLAAVVGAPPVLLFEECGAYQNYVVKRAMYHILKSLRKKGHSIIHSSFDIESHLPLTNRVAIIRDGYLHEIDYVDSLVQRHEKGFIVVVHLKDEVDCVAMFERYFMSVVTNDISDVLVNMQVLDPLSLSTIFRKMEQLKEENEQVYSYIVCYNSIDYIYHKILKESEGTEESEVVSFLPYLKRFFRSFRKTIKPKREAIERLQKFDTVYQLHKLHGLPWSVIFQR